MDSLWSQELQPARLPCASLSPGVCSNSCPLSWWCHATQSSHPLSFEDIGSNGETEAQETRGRSWAPRAPLPAWPKPEQCAQSSPAMPAFGFIPDTWLSAWGCKWLSHDNRVHSPSLSFSTKSSKKKPREERRNSLWGPTCVGVTWGMLDTAKPSSWPSAGAGSQPSAGPLQIPDCRHLPAAAASWEGGAGPAERHVPQR